MFLSLERICLSSLLHTQAVYCIKMKRSTKKANENEVS